MRIPVVLPVVRVAVSETGTLAVTLDGRPYAPDRPLTRDDLPEVLNEITCGQRTAVRVEVSEADGQTYADIATPLPDQSLPASTDDRSPATSAIPRLEGEGFRPGEEVAVAYVLMREVADHRGVARLQLPPALVGRRAAQLVLVGLDSKVMAHLEAKP